MLLVHSVAALLAFGLTSALMPMIIRIAERFRVMDYPDAARHVHAAPVPRLGGIAVFLGAVIASVGAFSVDRAFAQGVLTPSPYTPGLIVGVSIVFVLGLVDDVRGLRPAFKLVAQSLAALSVISYGFRIDHFTITGVETIHLGVLSVPVTMLWIVGVTNAFNLIDGVDGLAGAFGLIALLVCGVSAWSLGGSLSLVMSVSLGFALLAFLRLNWTPAKIFLGDSGSLVLGFFLAVQTVQSATEVGGTLRALTPIAALAYPILDTTVAVARRWLRGVPFSRADGRHVHHQLLALGITPARVVELLGVFFGGLAVTGLILTLSPPNVTLTVGLLASGLLLVTVFYATRWLRYTEFTEFGLSVVRVLLNARRHVARKVVANELAARLDAATSFDELNEMLADSAKELNLIEMQMLIGTPFFKGPAGQRISPPSQVPMRVDYPIVFEGPDGMPGEVVLRLWCARPTGHQFLGVDRVATLLGPAIERWLREHGGEVPAEGGAAGGIALRRSKLTGELRETAGE